MFYSKLIHCAYVKTYIIGKPSDRSSLHDFTESIALFYNVLKLIPTQYLNKFKFFISGTVCWEHKSNRIVEDLILAIIVIDLV